MADEQAQEEVETSPSVEEPADKEDSSEQPSGQVDNDSEVDKTPADTGKGDLSVALRQERDKRQQLEAQLSDPNFVYEQAKKLGLTEAEVESQMQGEIDAQPQVQQPQPDVYGTVNEILAYKEAVKDFAQAETDPEIQQMVNGLVQSGVKPADAVKTIKAKFEKAVQDTIKENKAQDEAEVSDQEKAQTASHDTTVSSDADEVEDLLKQSKSLDRKVSEQAHIELLKLRNKQEKIV